jgi:hypothetical protein
VTSPDGALPWIEVRSRYLAPPAQEVAADLLVEARLSAPNLQDAVNDGLQAAHSQLLGLTAAANAYVANPALVAAYEVEPGVGERQWTQRYQPPEHPIPPNTREISSPAAGALMMAAEHHPDRGRFGRVLAFYREALRHAETSSALLAVEYLHVTAETLTPLVRDQIRGSPGLSDKEMRERFGVSPADPRGEEALLRRIRLEEIYGGDNELRHAVERVSHGFEHGFEDLDHAKDAAGPIVLPASECVRGALLRAARLPPSNLSLLNAERFSVPMPLFSTEYLYVGKLRVSDETKLDPGTEPIEALGDWSTWVESSERRPDGAILVTTGGSARGRHDGLSVELKTAVQRLPVGLPAGARVPQHRLKRIEVLEGSGEA